MTAGDAATFAFGMPLSASATESVPIYWGDKQIFEVQYYGADDKNEITTDFFGGGGLPDYKILPYNLSISHREPS